ncbi:MAG: glycosyltransferase [Nitrospirae bacterium]|nr:glycosyltransferase [Nitrospirota bacterium]
MLKLSGFTFIRNAVSLDYPVVESISSILPVVDEFIVNIGPDNDDTAKLIQSIGNPKIKIVHSQWNPNMTTGAYIYAQQTNIALFNCTGKWAFYLQADEVIHENDLQKIMSFADRYAYDDRVDGLALTELSFWGDYRTVVDVYPQRKRRRCRIVKPHHFVMSRGDAAGFTVHPRYKEKGRRMRVIDTGIQLFHYCSVKSEKAMQAKAQTTSNYWSETKSAQSAFNTYYNLPRKFVAPYEGTHPAVMDDRISRHTISIDLSSPLWRNEMTWKERLRLLKTLWVEHITDRFSGRGSYILVKK